MIIKSYILENDPKKLLQYHSILFYGVNLGLKKEFKKSIRELNKKNLILNFHQEDLLKDQNLLVNEVSNVSLFEDEKLIFIENANDKIFSNIEAVMGNVKGAKIIVFSEGLDKKSKLRNYFEKSKENIVVPCYEDNEISFKNIILKKLKDFKGLTPQNLNIILENTDLDRIKLENEIAKIITFFNDKTLVYEKLEKLLNANTNDDFSILKDAAISGNKIRMNKLLSNTQLEIEKNNLYINIINQRMNKMYEIHKQCENSNYEEVITKIKPPIFWKDKPIFLNQLKKWNVNKIEEILRNTFSAEKKIKSSISINKNILIKKLLIDICMLANS